MRLARQFGDSGVLFRANHGICHQDTLMPPCTMSTVSQTVAVVVPMHSPASICMRASSRLLYTL